MCQAVFDAFEKYDVGPLGVSRSKHAAKQKDKDRNPRPNSPPSAPFYPPPHVSSLNASRER